MANFGSMICYKKVITESAYRSSCTGSILPHIALPMMGKWAFSVSQPRNAQAQPDYNLEVMTDT